MSKWLTEFEAATDEHCKARWCCRAPGEAFFCAFCGHKFKVGDEFRMIFTNDIPKAGGNPLSCRPCFDHAGSFEAMRRQWEFICTDYKRDMAGKYKYFAMRLR